MDAIFFFTHLLLTTLKSVSRVFILIIGKTHTMSGIQKIVTEDLFAMLHGNRADDESGCSMDNTVVSVSFFELYGGYVQDLLNNRNRLKILEDGKGEIHVNGLTEMSVLDSNSFLDIVAIGNGSRTTHMTEANDASSRSHAICQIMLRDGVNDKLLRGKLSLVDLAGSERGSDTKSHNQQRRTESADINTSLLTLKECIRALDSSNKRSMKTGTHHVPYRGSKLTLILKDCFTSDNAMTAMIATVSPGAASADHSINTLRYADRIKSQSPGAGSAGPPTSNINKGATQQIRIRSRLPSPKSQQNMDDAPNHNAVVNRYQVNEDKNKQQQHVSRSKNEDESHGSNSERNQIQTADTQQQIRLEQQKLNEDEQLYQQTMDALIEDEELILSTHMSNIQENAELLTVEGDLLSAIEQHQQNDANEIFASSAAFDEYVSALEEILDRKEEMILSLQKHVVTYEQHLKLRQNFNV
jgi:kinesin family member 2/24